MRVRLSVDRVTALMALDPGKRALVSAAVIAVARVVASNCAMVPPARADVGQACRAAQGRLAAGGGRYIPGRSQAIHAPGQQL